MVKIIIIVMICAVVMVAFAAYGQIQSEQYAELRRQEQTSRAVSVRPADDFSFALTWNVYGISSYDSRSGLLVKEADTDHTEDFTACLRLDEPSLSAIRAHIGRLDIDSMPSDVRNETVCDPPGVLNLTVRSGGEERHVACFGLYPESPTSDPKLKLYLDTCGALISILTSTDEWHSLPDWEKYYD